MNNLIGENILLEINVMVIESEDFILTPANQWGKTLVIAIFHIWANFYRYRLKGWNTLTRQAKWFYTLKYQTCNLSPVLDQAATA